MKLTDRDATRTAEYLEHIAQQLAAPDLPPLGPARIVAPCGVLLRAADQLRALVRETNEQRAAIEHAVIVFRAMHRTKAMDQEPFAAWALARNRARSWLEEHAPYAMEEGDET